MATTRTLEKLAGRARSRLVRRGTASEHRAVVLETDAGERLVLQRIGGNPFSDADTERLIGKPVAVEGFRVGDVFRYRSAEPSPKAPKPAGRSRAGR